MLVTLGILSFFSFIITFTATYFVKKTARSLNLIDNKTRRQHPAQVHTGSIPRAGGLALFLGIFIPILFFLPLNKALLGIILGSLLTVIIGLVDDWKDLNPYLRFIGNLICALIVVGGGIGIPFINNPFGGIIPLNTIRTEFNFLGSHSVLILADLVALIFIVWTMNVVGWSAGVDGQLPGFIAVSSFVLGILSLRFTVHDISQLTVTSLAFITMGSYLGFLPWNFYPQKIMPGYSGKTLAGFMLATLSILSGAKVGTMILVLGLPMTDALYTILRRIASGKSPFWADRGHFHHRLLDKGWGKRRIAVFYWLISAILGFVALSVSSRQKLFAFLTIMGIVGAVLFWTKKANQEFTRISGHSGKKSSPRNH